MMAEDKRWYLLKVRPTFEPLVQRELTRLDFETFLPEHSHRKFIKRNLLFPGHIFCRCDVLDQKRVLSSPGVLCILGIPDPLPFDDSDISDLRKAIICNLPSSVIQRQVGGEAVRILDGPLRDLTGIRFAREGERNLD